MQNAAPYAPYVRRPAGGENPALFSGIIMVALAFVTFVISIITVTGEGAGVYKITIIFEQITFILFALVLVLMVNLLHRNAPAMSVALASLAFMALSATFTIIALYVYEEWPAKVGSILALLAMTAIPATLIFLAFLSKDRLGPTAPLRSAAVPVSFACLLCGLLFGVLQVIFTFSENDYYYGLPGTAKAANVFQGFTFLGISAVLFLLLIPLLPGVRGSGLSVAAWITGGAAVIFALVWMILLDVIAFSDNVSDGLSKIWFVFSPLVLFAWGLSLALLARLASGPPLFARAAVYPGVQPGTVPPPYPYAPPGYYPQPVMPPQGYALSPQPGAYVQPPQQAAPMPTVACPNCGVPNSADASFCSRCGTAMKQA